MLTRLSIQGFKSLQAVQDLELGIVNLFIGANGSGKSNLLEALGLLSAAVSGQLDYEALLRRGVRVSTPTLFNSSFGNAGTAEKIRIGATWKLAQDTAEYQIEIGDAMDSPRLLWPYEKKYRLNDQDLNDPVSWESHEIFSDLLSNLWTYGVFSPNTPVLRGVMPETAQRQPVGLAGGQLAEAVNELLDVEQGVFGSLELDELFALLDWVDEMAIESPSPKPVSPAAPAARNIIRFTDRWMAEDRNRLFAKDASEGALYVLFALVLALHPRSPRLFAIDNFDQALHPRLARATTRLFCQQILKADPAPQVLLTTRNPLALDGLDLSDDRVRLFAVERSSGGTTQVHRLQISDEVLQATQTGLSLSNLWLMGRLGGMPDLL